MRPLKQSSLLLQSLRFQPFKNSSPEFPFSCFHDPNFPNIATFPIRVVSLLIISVLNSQSDDLKSVSNLSLVPMLALCLQTEFLPCNMPCNFLLESQTRCAGCKDRGLQCEAVCPLSRVCLLLAASGPQRPKLFLALGFVYIFRWGWCLRHAGLPGVTLCQQMPGSVGSQSSLVPRPASSAVRPRSGF